MKQIEDAVTQLIRRVKDVDLLSECVFIKGFESAECANPLYRYTIMVTVSDIKSSQQFIGENIAQNLKGNMVEVGVKFRICAPKKSNGDKLLNLAVELSKAIRSCDEQNLCQGTQMTGVEFDSDMMTVYRDVVAKLSFCLYEEVTV